MAPRVGGSNPRRSLRLFFEARDPRENVFTVQLREDGKDVVVTKVDKSYKATKKKQKFHLAKQTSCFAGYVSKSGYYL